MGGVRLVHSHIFASQTERKPPTCRTFPCLTVSCPRLSSRVLFGFSVSHRVLFCSNSSRSTKLPCRDISTRSFVWRVSSSVRRGDREASASPPQDATRSNLMRTRLVGSTDVSHSNDYSIMIACFRSLSGESLNGRRRRYLSSNHHYRLLVYSVMFIYFRPNAPGRSVLFPLGTGYCSLIERVNVL